jgi:spore coat polysaccharide biosynthesis protein SpsF
MQDRINLLAILQARVSSTRLPGKALKLILDQPMIIRQIERIQRAKLIDKLIIATSKDPSDDPLVAACKKLNLSYFRGNLDDVLDRFYQVAKLLSAEHIIRITGDCPLIDPHVIDEVIQFYLNGRFDYVSNALEPTYPDGLDVEVFSFKAIEQAWKGAVLPSQREHVTLFINQQPDKFRISNFGRSGKNLADLRWTVDEPEDLEFVRRVYEALYPSNPAFTTEDILALLSKEPSLIEINTGFTRNEGLIKSLQQDLLVSENSKGNQKP